MEQESVIHFLLPPYYTPRQALRILSEGLVFDLDNFLENKKIIKKYLKNKKSYAIIKKDCVLYTFYSHPIIRLSKPLRVILRGLFCLLFFYSTFLSACSIGIFLILLKSKIITMKYPIKTNENIFIYPRGSITYPYQPL